MRRISGGGIAGLGTIEKLRSVGALGVGLIQALRWLRHDKPKVVVGFGGYASLPTMVAAMILRIPTIIHEQNAVLGRANRLLAGNVGTIAVSFDSVASLPPACKGKTTKIGMPVRPAFTALGSEKISSASHH
ncbi:MAG: hypothetical protein HC834_00650 [Rhodospirillales bacterium]|nr:hypothetical protein [Rhodospirillales bacterium]